MKENWETRWKEYYKILQLDPSAEQVVVKGAYEKLSRKYHPDISKSPTANERMKDINEAYEILSDIEKRRRYDSAPLQKGDMRSRGQEPPIHPKPKPVVEPQNIRFDGVKPREIKKAFFIIRNIGGPYQKVYIRTPPRWIKIVSNIQMTTIAKLPLKVDIEVQGQDWGTHYVHQIIIKVDDIITSVRIELQTQPTPKPAPKPVVDPQNIKFDGVKPGEIRKGSFIVRNIGGPYNKFSLSTPSRWIKIVSHTPAIGTPTQPLKVDFEVTGGGYVSGCEGVGGVVRGDLK